MPSLLDYISAQQGQPNILGALQDEEFRKRVKQGLLDAANRGVVAGLPGGFVDMAAMPINAVRGLMGKAPIEKPVGGSEWLGGLMEKAGMVSPERNAPAELLAGLALPGAMAKGAAKVGPKVEQAVVRAMENAQARPTLNPQTGAIVWHGSPQKFDKFDSSKIGTGEGAQAYGHGLYLAESPGVADSYRKALSDNVFTVNGKDVLGPASKYGTTAQSPSRASLSMPEKMASYALDSAVKAGSADPAADAIAHLSRHGKGNPDALAALEMVRQWKSQGAKLEAGNLYKVDLPDEAIAKMLDWDKPLSQQPEAVRAAAAKRVSEIKALGGNPPADPSGEWLHRAFHPQAGEQGFGQSLAADRLREAGIPGIRYLDAGSRGTGQGTSNFVVFPGNEGLLTILERNGQRLEQTARPPFQYPQAEALETARKNAVTMLGLPENNTAMDRARALGFDTEAYKGMHPYDPNTGEVWGVRNGRFVPVENIGAEPEVIRSVDPSRTSKMELGGRHAGFYGGKDIANAFAGYTSKNSAVFPVLLNMGKSQETFEGAGKHAGAFQFERPAAMNDNLEEYKRFQRAFLADSPASGAVIRDTVDEGTIFIPREGKQVRSRFAAFDPARVNENDLLGRADLNLLGALAAGGAGAAAANEAGLLDWLKRKKEK